MLIWLLHTALLLGQGQLTHTYGVDARNCQDELFRAGRIIQTSDDNFNDDRLDKRRIERACFNNFRTIKGRAQLPGVRLED